MEDYSLESLQSKIAESSSHFRDGVRKVYGDRYAKEIENRITLVRDVMKRSGKSAIWAAYKIMEQGDAERKRDPLFVCAAVEIAEESDGPVIIG